MYYIRLSEENPNSIVYYCKNCGHENKNISLDSVTISRTNFKSSKQKYNSIINKYTKMDPTLPRINTIKCPNQSCESNQEHEASPRTRPHPNPEGSKGSKDKGKGKGEGADESKGAAVASAAEDTKTDVLEKNRRHVDREIIYLRYDDVNMNFVYLCPVCDSVWNTTQ